MSSKQGLFVVAVALLSALPAAPASDVEHWVPARWQGGPLELERRAGLNTTPSDSAVREILENWYQPATLDLLKDTPVNCLLVTWSAGGDPATQRRQQRLVAEYARESRGRGISIFGIVYPGYDPAGLIDAALEAKLGGLVFEGDLSRDSNLAGVLKQRARTAPDLTVILLSSQSGFSRAEDSPVLATSEAVPQRFHPISDAVTATATTEPWVDSNTGLVRSLRARGNLPVWLGHALDHPSADDYLRAIADTAMAGGRWVLSPDDALMAGLWRREPQALAAWRRIAESLTFHEEQATWRSFLPEGPLGVLQDDSGKLLGRRARGVQLFNVSSVYCYLSSNDSGKRLLVQLINYASAPTGNITVRLGGDYRAARLFRPGHPPERLPIEKIGDRMQVAVREIPVYAAILFEKE